MVVVPGRGVSTVVPRLPEGGAGPTLLLIDRQPLFLAALGSLLTAPPVCARIFIAHDTDAGLDLALQGDVQLVFCEVRSVPIPAVDVAERLWQLTPRVPVILLGEPEDERLMAAALHTCVAGLFTKDAALDEFLVGVQTVLSGHRAVGSQLMGMVLSRLSDGAPHPRRPASQLSPTELDILTMIGEAKSIPVIAAARGISHKTVRNHLANIYRKLDLRSRTEAMLCAARMGLTTS
ncbi:MAG TPA: response regulator transcription factor [Candidatus Nitrosopolaris sp.]|nr:response regulator transcription factor [Candidatus Nitrosopolaris sp.]